VRATGPPESKAPKPFPPPTKKAKKKNDNRRQDGRDAVHFRQIFMKTGMISQASGSAYLEMNNTKVICGVYGPKQSPTLQEFSKKGKLFCDFKYATFAGEGGRKGFVPNPEEKECSMLMLQALEVAVCLDRFPKSVVEVFVLVIQNDGGALSAAITCASLALSDAGIEMYDLVTACQASMMATGVLVLDPMMGEEKEQKGSVVLARMPSLNELTMILMVGQMDLAPVTESVELCIDGCDKLHAIMRDVLIESALSQQQNK